MAEVWKEYRRKPRTRTEMRPYVPGEAMVNISISFADEVDGHPKPGDMIARNAANHGDQWLVAQPYFIDNYEEAT